MTSCGPLIIGGFAGLSLPAHFGRALADGHRGGAILFRRNLDGSPAQVAALIRSIRGASRVPTLVGVDQEGGRVARLGAPFLEVPAMRTVASWGDTAFAERIARVVGAELAAVGFNLNFAPVLDVDTRPGNPIIGDRAFASDAETCARFGIPWIRGLASAGLLACGKHFPGHGDTLSDSHLDLPVLDLTRDRLERVELVPFRAAAAAGMPCMMSAHVLYSAIDARQPATLSRAACTGLRSEVGFGGVLFSDDLEMRAIAGHWSIEDASVQAILAGCDALLICSNEDAQERALAALEREANSSPAFRARCEEAVSRLEIAQREARAQPLEDRSLADVVGSAEARAVALEIGRRLGR
jgi:beta-N-acetylhexosaminidase